MVRVEGGDLDLGREVAQALDAMLALPLTEVEILVLHGHPPRLAPAGPVIHWRRTRPPARARLH